MAGALLAAQTVAFLIWAWLMFRMLWVLEREAGERRAREGVGFLGGIGVTVATFAGFVTAPRHRRLRRRVALATIALFALIGLRLWWLTSLAAPS